MLSIVSLSIINTQSASQLISQYKYKQNNYSIIPVVYGLIPSTVNLSINESGSIKDTTSVCDNTVYCWLLNNGLLGLFIICLYNLCFSSSCLWLLLLILYVKYEVLNADNPFINASLLLLASNSVVW